MRDRAMASISSLRRALNGVWAREDLRSGAIAAAAAVVFLGSAMHTARPALNATIHASGGADRVALVALILNLALMVLAWARHRDARRQRRARLAAEQQAHVLRTRD